MSKEKREPRRPPFATICEQLLYQAAKAVSDSSEISCTCVDSIEDCCPWCQCALTVRLVDSELARRRKRDAEKEKCELPTTNWTVSVGTKQTADFRGWGGDGAHVVSTWRKEPGKQAALCESDRTSVSSRRSTRFINVQLVKDAAALAALVLLIFSLVSLIRLLFAELL